MTKEINIIIENKLTSEKRDMNVYHHSTRSAHIISFDSSVTLPLRSIIEDDYLYISIVSGPGNLEKKSVVNLPAWVDFEFLSEGKLTVTHSGERTLLKIPAGLPEWQLKLTRSVTSLIDRPADRVTIGDDYTEFL
jgi:hypothetical protein